MASTDTLGTIAPKIAAAILNRVPAAGSREGIRRDTFDRACADEAYKHGFHVTGSRGVMILGLAVREELGKQIRIQHTRLGDYYVKGGK